MFLYFFGVQYNFGYISKIGFFELNCFVDVVEGIDVQFVNGYMIYDQDSKLYVYIFYFVLENS